MSKPSQKLVHRHSVKKFFITFPQCAGVSRSDFFDQLNFTYKIIKCIIAQEPHKDGQPHLHAAVEYETAITKYQLLQEMKKSYPDEFQRIDIQSMKSFAASITYLTSPDKDKIVDTEPFMFNVTIDHVLSMRHVLFHTQFSDETPVYRADACGCKECELFLIKHFDQEYEEQRQFIKMKELISFEDIQIS